MRVNVQRVYCVGTYGFRALVGGGVVLWTDHQFTRTTRDKLRQLVADKLGTNPREIRLFY